MNLWIFGRGIFSMKDEPQVIFEDFIGHYKGFFSDENIEEFFEFWNFAERVFAVPTRSRYCLFCRFSAFYTEGEFSCGYV